MMGTFIQSRLNLNSIRVAMNTLPVGISYFKKTTGKIVLCNNIMYEIYLELTGKFVQWHEETKTLLNQSEDHIFTLRSGNMWMIREKEIVIESGELFYEVIASNVTDLQKMRSELERRN